MFLTAVSMLRRHALIRKLAAGETLGSVSGPELNRLRAWTTAPTPTSVSYFCLLVAAQAGIWKAHLERQFPRRAEVPFDSERKRMTTIHSVHADSIPLGNALRLVWSSNRTDTPLSHVAFTKSTCAASRAEDSQQMLVTVPAEAFGSRTYPYRH